MSAQPTILRANLLAFESALRALTVANFRNGM
jgi:hypothetical protein